MHFPAGRAEAWAPNFSGNNRGEKIVKEKETGSWTRKHFIGRFEPARKVLVFPRPGNGYFSFSSSSSAGCFAFIFDPDLSSPPAS